jgi:esterase/lipase superfamily enzyme
MADVRVYFATNRNYQPTNKLQVFGGRFNPDGVAALRFGVARFSSNADGSPSLQGVEVYSERTTSTTIKGGSERFLDDLRQAMAGERSDTLVFIHGFNVTFAGALDAAARLAMTVTVEGRPVNVVLFSWPSDGQAVPLMSYYSDREDARASGPALARAYLKLRDYLVKLNSEDYCQRCLHLLAHSMGAYVLRNAVQAVLAKDPTAVTRLFDQILLAAPDEDDDTFEYDQKLRLLPRFGRRVTVYFNPHDKALLVSDKTKSNPDRLGSDGPRMIDLIPKKIELVDCRVVARHADSFVGHSYYIRSRAMAEDLARVLSDADPIPWPNRVYVDKDRAWRIVAELGG